MKKMTQLMGIATVVLATGLANADSPATGKVESRSTTVSFRRTDAQTLEGAQGLYARLRSAAADVCVEVIAPQGVSSMEYRSCVSTAVDGAVREANVPLLSLLHGHRGPIIVALNAR